MTQLQGEKRGFRIEQWMPIGHSVRSDGKIEVTITLADFRRFAWTLLLLKPWYSRLWFWARKTFDVVIGKERL